MKKVEITYLLSSPILLMCSLNGCIEPFDAVFEDFESALVIEATLTNEPKRQQVVLSRTYEFEVDGPTAEVNATVRVVEGQGTGYDFVHSGNGVYLSTGVFAAQGGVDYQLEVMTQDGRNYASEVTRLTPTATIDEVKAARITNDMGEDGIAILVDSFDPTGNAKNYRYEYQETYKVIAPNWSFISLAGDPQGGCGVIEVPNTTGERVCYPTNFSNRIILTSTENLQEDRVSDFMVRFIRRDNYIISHRYSILVRQFVQSNAAYTFFETLNELSGSESLLSQTQPGFLQGNVFSRDNGEERVLGYFDVSSVSEQRLFFNYDEFYPGEPLPPYISSCELNAPLLLNLGGACLLRPIVENGLALYAGDNDDPIIGIEGPYYVVDPVCGDCSSLGTAEVPEFWIE